ncbi:hypothetical protein DNL40_02245 [Xylanimonas oleitrophica]|uniref:Uncharacterized protein n=1 Tax=Xylanimonas oleitrophica TaxID=2607479 RepID=A0A2W5YJ63_9MICO|nr:hypothetical protein [Xylanimonas oleitrophica]PZR55211.1 hypothetical protein DNL40_02245 [Xylanimonas oleitrophica]
MKTNAWTHPTTGQIRHYLDNYEVWGLIAYDVHGVANRGRVLSAKFWLDQDGVLHIDRLEERGQIREYKLRAAIEAALAPAPEGEPAPETAETQAAETEATEAATEAQADLAFAAHVATLDDEPPAEEPYATRPRRTTMRPGWSNARRYR